MATWTQADIDKLKGAIASGVRSVTYDGGKDGKRTIEYQDLDAMRALLAEMVRQVAAPATSRLASFSKGFDPPFTLGNGGGFNDGSGNDG